MIEAIIKKVSLAKGMVEEDVHLLWMDLFKQMRDEMGKQDLQPIKLKNLASFIPDVKKMRLKRRMCNIMIEKGNPSERILELKETIDKNIDKQFKQKRCKTD